MAKIKSENQSYFFAVLAKHFVSQLYFYLIVFMVIISDFLSLVKDLAIGKGKYVRKKMAVSFLDNLSKKYRLLLSNI